MFDGAGRDLERSPGGLSEGTLEGFAEGSAEGSEGRIRGSEAVVHAGAGVDAGAGADAGAGGWFRGRGVPRKDGWLAGTALPARLR